MKAQTDAMVIVVIRSPRPISDALIWGGRWGTGLSAISSNHIGRRVRRAGYVCLYGFMIVQNEHSCLPDERAFPPLGLLPKKLHRCHWGKSLCDSNTLLFHKQHIRLHQIASDSINLHQIAKFFWVVILSFSIPTGFQGRMGRGVRGIHGHPSFEISYAQSEKN
jgi:hypothetical protein